MNYEIPDELHRRIKSRAALKGQTLYMWVLEAFEKVADEEEEAERAGK